jgi:phosphatidylserine/phosphatidylglycerophosphate/cardiolipin synthase-like enzyme
MVFYSFQSILSISVFLIQFYHNFITLDLNIAATIAKALLNAHKRGVKVEVILDKSQRTDKYSSATFSLMLADLSK